MTDNQKYLEELKNELKLYTQKLSKIQGSFSGKAGKEATNIVKSLHQILAQTNTAYENLKSATSEEWAPMKKLAHESITTLKDKYDAVKDSIVDDVTTYSEEKVDAVAQYVQSHPMKSILIAGAVGLLLGRFLK